jgi:biotin carboxylase
MGCRFASVHDAEQLIAAARTLTSRQGALNHIVTAQETLLEPVAQTREALNVPGMSSETVRRTLDKSLLKSTLRRAGITTRARSDRYRRLEDACALSAKVVLPIMLKPLKEVAHWRAC